MNRSQSETKRSRGLSPKARIALGLFFVAIVSFVLFAHPFLAVTKRVDADILVVEGWIPDHMLTPAVREFHQGKYSLFLVSGLLNDPADDRSGLLSDALRTASRLEELGVRREQVIACPAPFARWRRTSKTARAVRDEIFKRSLTPRGINVVTAGPHARETWVAYEHAFGERVPVGIISIPKTNYPADRWWLSRQGLIWVPKDFIAWLKEVLIGQRS